MSNGCCADTDPEYAIIKKAQKNTFLARKIRVKGMSVLSESTFNINANYLIELALY